MLMNVISDAVGELHTRRKEEEDNTVQGAMRWKKVHSRLLVYQLILEVLSAAEMHFLCLQG